MSEQISFSDIAKLMEKLSETNLGELYIKSGEFELKIQSKQETTVITESASNIVREAPSIQQVANTVEVNIPQEAVKKQDGNVQKAPIVGTFYKAAAPDKPAFVEVGSKVKKGDVLCVIESMKLMNEIQSEFDGEVVEILVDNAQGVEYNQPIMIIK